LVGRGSVLDVNGRRFRRAVFPPFGPKKGYLSAKRSGGRKAKVNVGSQAANLIRLPCGCSSHASARLYFRSLTCAPPAPCGPRRSETAAEPQSTHSIPGLPSCLVLAQSLSSTAPARFPAPPGADPDKTDRTTEGAGKQAGGKRGLHRHSAARRTRRNGFGAPRSRAMAEYRISRRFARRRPSPALIPDDGRFIVLHTRTCFERSMTPGKLPPRANDAS
jgi:hypothetical protein